MTRKQIERENAKKAFRALQKSPIDDDVSITLVKDNFYHWTVTLLGTDGSFYENGVFFLDFVFPKQYPVQPPKVKFETRIYHVNITKSGRVCIPLFDDEWEFGRHTVRDVIFEIQDLFSNPIFDSPINGVAGQLFHENPQLYEKVARKWTKEYATADKNITFKQAVPKDEKIKKKNESDNKADDNNNNNNNNDNPKKLGNDFLGDINGEQYDYDPMFVVDESDYDTDEDDNNDNNGDNDVKDENENENANENENKNNGDKSNDNSDDKNENNSKTNDDDSKENVDDKSNDNNGNNVNGNNTNGIEDVNNNAPVE